jgi:hypothetical protein
VKLLLLLLLPQLAWAQAEQAPESYRPPRQPGMPQPQEAAQRQADSKLPKWHIAVAPHFNVLLAEPLKGLPRYGYGAGVQVTRALVPIGRARFGVGADFAYDRFSFEDVGTKAEYVSHATFAAMLVLDGISGRFRPWLALGGGFSVATYLGPDFQTPSKAINLVGVAGLVKVAAGLGVRVYQGFELGLRADINVTLSGQNVAGTDIWQPGLFSLGLDFGYRF